MLVIPIKTEVRPRKTPVVNYALIGLNVFIFLMTDVLGGPQLRAVKDLFMLDAGWPALYQYLTYQFLHGDIMHLAGNMLFLWIFGNSVCDRLGGRVYLLFYLGGGVAAGAVYAGMNDGALLGASGAIAAVTTAFLVLFPRVQIVLLAWLFYFITTLQVPAMIIITFKIILWDNIVAPALSSGPVSNVAYSAHLGGYAFGFLIAMVMLLVRALPRNQFDLLALWSRKQRRSGWQFDVGRTPHTRARPVRAAELNSEPSGALELTPLERLREQILDQLEEGRVARAAELHEQLLKLDAGQVLPRRQQLELANYLNQTQRRSAAARAYEGFLSAYPGAPERPQVHLLLGLMYSRYLDQARSAVDHLENALAGLTQRDHRRLAEDELNLARARAVQR